ncbi:MAG TPA: SAM-dependent chlorinase/fluorinase [Actinomycetota bacterium]|nr:SAM-dependent chlorinase/fluorinase [Actinomycetota bacterium]
MTRPIVFLTDYGLSDPWVGICHGVMFRIVPDAHVIDLTHAVPRQDVLRGAIELGRAIEYLPPEAVYLAVVDPGVGSDRRAVAVAAGAALLVGPDNGVLSLAWEALGGVEAAVWIENEDLLLTPVSRTFHGRDVFAPAAAHLAAGLSLADLGPSVDVGALRRLEVPSPMVAPGAVGARVTGVDGFGNVQLNATIAELLAADLEGERVLVVNGRRLPRAGTFAELPEHEPGMIVDSDGYLAVVVNHGSAATTMRLGAGDPVVIERP